MKPLPSPEEFDEIMKVDPIGGLKVVHEFISETEDQDERMGMEALFQLVVTYKIIAYTLAWYGEHNDADEVVRVMAKLSLQLEESLQKLIS